MGLVLTMVFVLSACDRNVSVLEEVEEENKLTYALVGENEPFNYEGENGERQGFNVDIAKEIADRIGVEAEPVEVEKDSMFTDLLASEHDLVVGVPATEDAEIQVELTKPYYLDQMSDEDNLEKTNEMAIAVKKSDEKFLSQVNELLEEMVEDGTYGQITEKWFDGDKTEEIKSEL